MKLSENTIAVLKNFSAINPNLVFRQGNELKTISVAKNILANATVDETFPIEFGVYDLNEFLNALSLFESPELNFASNEFVQLKEGPRALKYHFSAMDMLTTPSKNITMPNADIKFVLKDSDLALLRKASSNLGVSELTVCGAESAASITLQVADPKNPTSNVFTLDVDLEGTVRPGHAFKMVFNIANFKLIPGDYNVELSSKLISRFEHVSSKVEYFIALERNSEFNA